MENLDNSLGRTEENLIHLRMLDIMYSRDAKELTEVIKVLPDDRIRLLLE